MIRRQAVQIAKCPVTWILVADSRQAQVYARHKVEKHVPMVNSRHYAFEEVIACEPVPVAGMRWKAESPAAYEIGRKQLGRVFESANAAHHMNEPRLDIREEIRNHFARMLAERINQARSTKQFDRLVLIAPAKMLGEIKKRLNKNVLKCVAAELPKELTHYDKESLAEHLGGIA